MQGIVNKTEQSSLRNAELSGNSLRRPILSKTNALGNALVFGKFSRQFRRTGMSRVAKFRAANRFSNVSHPPEICFECENYKIKPAQKARTFWALHKNSKRRDGESSIVNRQSIPTAC
jgi:hypothetical protein